MIQSPPQKYIPKEVEEKIQNFWTEHDIFKKSIKQRKDRKPYIFLEGPPTANGLPHPGHVLTRVMKDLVLRYQTMNGHFVEVQFLSPDFTALFNVHHYHALA